MSEGYYDAWVCLLGSVLECVSSLPCVTRLTCLSVGSVSTVISGLLSWVSKFGFASPFVLCVTASCMILVCVVFVCCFFAWCGWEDVSLGVGGILVCMLYVQLSLGVGGAFEGL